MGIRKGKKMQVQSRDQRCGPSAQAVLMVMSTCSVGEVVMGVASGGVGQILHGHDVGVPALMLL